MNAKPKAGQQNVSTRLSREDVEALEGIAQDWGVTPHALRVFAIKRLIADEKSGRFKPKKKSKTIAILEP